MRFLSVILDWNILLVFLRFFLSFFIISILVSWLIFRKFKNRRLSFSLGFGHFLFICYVALIVYINKEVAQCQLYWFFPEFVDFPISLLSHTLILNIEKMMGGSWIPGTIYAPFTFFAIFGSFWYYFLGRIIEIVITQKNQKNIRAFLAILNLSLLILVVLGLFKLVNQFVTLSSIKKSVVERSFVSTEILAGIIDSEIAMLKGIIFFVVILSIIGTLLIVGFTKLWSSLRMQALKFKKEKNNIPQD